MRWMVLPVQKNALAWKGRIFCYYKRMLITLPLTGDSHLYNKRFLQELWKYLTEYSFEPKEQAFFCSFSFSFFQLKLHANMFDLPKQLNLERKSKFLISLSRLLFFQKNGRY